MTQKELRSVSRNARFDLLAAFQKLNPELEAITRPRIVESEEQSPAVQAVAKAINDVEDEMTSANTDDERKELLKTQKRIANAVIGRGVEALKDGSMRISPKDLQNFLVMQQELFGFSFDQGGQVRGTESVRVKFAREQGDDILTALRKDIQDQSTIAQALWDARQQAKEHEEQTEQERKRLMNELNKE